MLDADNKDTPLTHYAAYGVLIALTGVLIGYLFGKSVLVPLIGTALAWWITGRNFAWWKRTLIPAFAVQTGHLIWLGLGVAFIGFKLENSLDLIILTFGLFWLIAKPSRAPVYFLSAYQMAALTVNAMVYLSVADWNSINSALAIHIFWRVLALFLLFRLYLVLSERLPRERRFTVRPVLIDRRQTAAA